MKTWTEEQKATFIEYDEYQRGKTSDLKFDTLPFKLTTVGGLDTDRERFKISNITNVKMSETHLTLKVNYTEADIIS